MKLAARTFLVGLLVAALMSIAGIAAAQSGGSIQEPRNPNIQGSTETRGDTDSGSDSLPFTGADVALFAAIGFAAIGTGMVIVRTARARQNA